MEIKDNFVFQTDSDIVRKVYNENPNYLIEYSDNCERKDYCTIYFCSNDIYFPNTEEIFNKRIIGKNFYEWYNLRVSKSHKHIFVRDIYKQWYLTGINAEINNPEKLLDFLRNETAGYKVITLGSSAGGYAAVLYGSLLQADQVMIFNAQFEVSSLLSRSTEKINPLLFRLKEEAVSKYFDIKKFINENIDIFYFYSNKSKWDVEQYKHIKDLKINKISFSTAHHGIPFLKTCLSKVINSDKDTLLSLTFSTQRPYLFSVKTVGFWNVLSGLISQAYKAYAKRR